ncbi:hypothetical protein QJS66_13900 [Kocuria rhizophila]|nr:hypothetical protein QJS66_13900 [Kocuria rhizophila]
MEPHTGVHHLVSRHVHDAGARAGRRARCVSRSHPARARGAPDPAPPKIINQLETTARHTGASGVSPVAGLAVNVAIRTFEFSGGPCGWAWAADRRGLWTGGEASRPLCKAAPPPDGGGPPGPGGAVPERRSTRTRQVATPGCACRWRGVVARGGILSGRARYPLDPHPTLDFTTMLVREGRPEQLAEHLARLGEQRAGWLLP